MARADIPREIADAIDTALETSPAKRRITCTELEQWLATMINPRAAEQDLREHVASLRATPSSVGAAPELASAPALAPAPSAVDLSTEEPEEAPAPSATEVPGEKPEEAPAPSAMELPAEKPEEAPPPADAAERSAMIDPPAKAPAAAREPASGAPPPLSPLGFLFVALITAILVIAVGVTVGDRIPKIFPLGLMAR